MTPARRWLIVGVSILVLVGVPVAIRALPAPPDRTATAELLAKVKASSDVTYSGYAESVGGLSLPVSGEFEGLTDLLGDQTQLRVWWQGPGTWRVDTIDATGESDQYQDGTTTWTWEYEANRATRSITPVIRLPRAADLLPSELGRRLLSEADPIELSPLGSESVAGIDAPGIRLRPKQPGSTIDHVDVWIDPESGLPLKVLLGSKDASRPAVATQFLELTVAPPSTADTTFVPPPGARVRYDDTVDLLAAVNRFAPATPPDSLAGLPLRTEAEGIGSVGTYGTGVTVLVAVPLPRRVSGPLRNQLVATPGAIVDEVGVASQAGPINILVGEPGARGRSWVVAGTVDLETLRKAAVQLGQPNGSR